jgi:hypothetical protein
MKKGDTIIVIEGTIIITEDYTSQGNPSRSASDDDAAAEWFGRARYIGS